MFQMLWSEQLLSVQLVFMSVLHCYSKYYGHTTRGVSCPNWTPQPPKRNCEFRQVRSVRDNFYSHHLFCVTPAQASLGGQWIFVGSNTAQALPKG